MRTEGFIYSAFMKKELDRDEYMIRKKNATCNVIIIIIQARVLDGPWAAVNIFQSSLTIAAQACAVIKYSQREI